MLGEQTHTFNMNAWEKEIHIRSKKKIEVEQRGGRRKDRKEKTRVETKKREIEREHRARRQRRKRESVDERNTVDKKRNTTNNASDA